MTLEQAIKRNPYDPEKGNESAYCRYLRYNVDGWYSLDNKEVCKRWKNGKENNMIYKYDFLDEIRKFHEEQYKEREQELAEIIERYDFIVGSAELKGKLESILPDGANIVYSKYVESPTTIYAIKKFDTFDFSFKPLDN